MDRDQESTIITIVYATTVRVEVDLDRQAVTRVVVEDWNLSHPTLPTQSGGLAAASSLITLESRRAYQVAEADLWPAWEVGE